MQYSPPRNNSLGFALTKKHAAQAFSSKPAPAAAPEFDEPSFSQMQRPRFDSINAKQYGIIPEHTDWDGDLHHYSKPEGSPTSQRSLGQWASDVPAPVTPDPRWGGGNSRADSDESSEHGFSAGSMRRRVAMNLAAAHPETFADDSGSHLPLPRSSGSGEGVWGGSGAGGGPVHSSSTHLGGITEDIGDYDDGSNMYHVAGGGLVSDGEAFVGGTMGEDPGKRGGFAGGMQYGQAGLAPDHGVLPQDGTAGDLYGGGQDDGLGGYQDVQFGDGPAGGLAAEASAGLLPLPSLSASSPSPLNSSAPAVAEATPRPGARDLLHAAAAGLAPATRTDGGADKELMGAAASPPRTASLRTRARSFNLGSVNLGSGQGSDAVPASPAALSPRSVSSSRQGGGGAHAAGLSSPRLASSSGEKDKAAGGAAAGDLCEPMDTEALEADLAAVLRRLPASSRYGSRDGASELVASGVVQQLYARVTRLQSLLRRREADAHEANERSHALDAQLTEVQAAESQLNAQLMEATRKLATRDHELLTAQQRVKDAETRARATSAVPPDGNMYVGQEELDRMQQQLQEAKAQLAVRDAELASASQAIAGKLEADESPGIL
ncbi:hypothetical protein DUNSADRAFT_17593 [Dunaliella salina]|uniref:Uncharacterized protein n=1 Tax=Dunaliella salina TaxID=3046 RepID=A0ABQ7G1H8_DUNSA|nr:hypothetical protein DUNSADRAFT_17593 [Dunaliella salina]|eukprot:KAF5828464.1 hypothetical protein DUNSADRAFT_17593 [Dunaliella salina]